MPEVSRSLRVYRRLLRLFPAAFQEEYGTPMERAFRDEMEEAGGASATLWARLILDLAISLPVQLAREAMLDARHTLRLWGQRPWQTVFAVTALAIGIGANVGVFSVVNALLLKSLPFRDPEQLVSVLNFQAPHANAKEFDEWRRASAYLSDAALVSYGAVTIGWQSGAMAQGGRAHGARASSNYFSFLGAQPVIGRAFEQGENADVVILGYGLWQNLFAGEARVLGSRIRVNSQNLTVIGVAPKSFNYPANADLWMPATLTAGDNGGELIARLKPGVTVAQASQAAAIEAERLMPTRTAANRARFPGKVASLQDTLAGPVKTASLFIMGSVALILLLACTNVANLLMARTADRFGELSIRSALGASRARITQQLLTESVLLSLVAAVIGLGVAVGTVRAISTIQPAPLASQAYEILDVRVLLFAIAASVATGLIFGILPSLYANRAQTLQVRGVTATRMSRWIRESLVAVQVMLTILLLAGSAAVGREFLELMKMDRGYDTQHVATISVSIEGTTRKSAPLPYFEQVIEQLRAIPGVRSATATDFLPLDATMFMGGPFGLDRRRASENSMIVPVMPDYVQTMGGRILYGREITADEVRNDTKVAVVNERFAREFGSPEYALNHMVTLGRQIPWRVVGVVKDMDYDAGIYDANSLEIFVPAHDPGGFYPTFAIRVDGNADQYLAKLRDVVQSVDSQVVVYNAKTMGQRLSQTMVRPRFYTTGAFCFAAFGILLAVIGIYGLVSYAVAQRTKEMGIRMALGTTAGRLRGGLLGRGLLPVVAGSVPGTLAAVLASRYLGSLIIGTQPVNVGISSATIALVMAVATVSSWTASRKIARLDVMEILRSE